MAMNKAKGSQDALSLWCEDHLASLGSNNLSASILRSLSQLVSLLITQLCM